MAAVSTLPVARRKKHVYGKLSSKSNWNLDAFFDEDELVASEARQPVRQPQTQVAELNTVKQTRPKNSGPDKQRPRPKRQDTFDVPPSDDESTFASRNAPVAGFKVRNALVDDTDSSIAPLAPWERKRAQSDRDAIAKKRRNEPASPDAQLKQDLERATLSPERQTISPPSQRSRGFSGNELHSAKSPTKSSPNDASSAAARLAARRKEEVRPLTKRSALPADEIEGTPRKRARTATPSRDPGEDVIMADILDDPICDMSRDGDRNADVFDIPASSEDELQSSKIRKQAPKHTKMTIKHGKLTGYSSKPSTKKGISAPARLAEMIATDTDTTEPPTRSPSIVSRRSTSQHAPSTPPSGKMVAPETALRTKGTMTPKQAQLWSQLLPSDPIAPSPSALAIKDLSITGARRQSGTSINRTCSKSQSDIPVRRTRLVDRLQTWRPTSADESSEESEDDVAQVATKDSNEHETATTPQRRAVLERKPSQASQSQSQPAATGANGPKITYSTMRSYLPEDTLEADLMAGLESESPAQPTQSKFPTKSGPIAQKSTFDLDDNDEEGNHPGIRTIHELRASGRTISGMYDIQELLSEIHNHNVSHRGRRRSALIELATKLTDKTFAIRFVGQSLETELARECTAASDEIAEFVLAAALTLVLVSEPPEHTVRSLHEEGVVMFLVKVLEKDVDIMKLAKDRKNNMAKLSQRSLSEFTSLLTNQTVLWNEEKPAVLTPRLVALKALDLLIGKLRRMGDRSDLIGADKVQLLLPDRSISFEEGSHFDLALSISILESLSTSSASLRWPSTTVETVANMLPQLNAESSVLRHVLFLMLRLCLNLTNDNVKNCERFSASPSSISYLLATVKSGFGSLDSVLEDEQRALALDLLVLTMGIMINLAEKCDTSRKHALQDNENLSSLIAIFQRGQQNMLDAESVEESVSNVAYGYLAVMLSNVCQNAEARAFIASKLPGKNLGMLVEAVEEFVLHHQKVDMMNFEGEEGAEVWGAFTEKLKVVLARLKEREPSI